MRKTYRRSAFLLLIFQLACTVAALFPPAASAEASIDRIVAVVEDGVILESELSRKVEAVKRSLQQNNTQLPPDEILARQVLEKLIIDKIQLQLAERAGLRVDDETVRQAVLQIAERNKMTPEQLRASLRQEGIEYAEFVEQIRTEIAIGRYRTSQINNQIKISDREVDNYLATHGKSDFNRNTEFLLGHILIATPQAAAPETIQKARDKAEQLMGQLEKGLDFKQAAVSSSNSDQALSGGDLGWRKLGQIPTLFAEPVTTMKEGEIRGPIRSPSGFHIIKLLGLKGGSVDTVTKTHVRHILIRPNEVLSDDDARNKLLVLRERIEGGDEFATLARGHSDDKGSAIKGGDLGWVQPGALVPQFEETMNKLEVKELSNPVQTQFGWHLIQVLERQQSSDTEEMLKTQAREELFKRKVDEETELWMRRIRDEAYVEIRLSEPVPETFMPTSQ